MQREDQVRVQDIIDAGEAIARFIEGRQRRDFDTDQMLVFAVVRAIEIIGEAASRISSETRDSFQAVPWRDTIDMRNVLIHAYSRVDNDIVWKTATEEVPALLATLKSLLDSA